MKSHSSHRFMPICLIALAALPAGAQVAQTAPPAPQALELGIESRFVTTQACIGYDLGDPFVLTGLMGTTAGGKPVVVNPPPLGVQNDSVALDQYPYFSQAETSYAYIPPDSKACPENTGGKIVFAYVDQDPHRRKAGAMGDRPRWIAAESIRLEDLGKKLPAVAKMGESDFDGNDTRLIWVQGGTVYLFWIGVRRGPEGFAAIEDRAGEWHGFQVMRSTDCGKTWAFDSFVSAEDETILPACPKEAWWKFAPGLSCASADASDACKATCNNNNKNVFTFEGKKCHCNSSSDYPISYVDPYDKTQWLINGGTIPFYRQKDKDKNKAQAFGYVARFRLTLDHLGRVATKDQLVAAGGNVLTPAGPALTVASLYPKEWDKGSPLFAYPSEEIFLYPKAVTSLPEKGKGSGTGGWLVVAGADSKAMLPIVMITRDRGAHWQSVNLAEKDRFKKFDLDGRPMVVAKRPLARQSPAAMALTAEDEPNAPPPPPAETATLTLAKLQFRYEPVLKYAEQTSVKLSDQAVFDESDPRNGYPEDTEQNAFSRVAGDKRPSTPTGWGQKITLSLARGAADPGNSRIKRILIAYPRADVDFYTPSAAHDWLMPTYIDVSLLTLECDPGKVAQPCTNIKLKKLAKLKAKKGESTFNGRFIQADPRYNAGAENEDDVAFVYYESLGPQGIHASANSADAFFDPPYVVEKYVIFDAAGRIKKAGTLSPAKWTAYGPAYMDYSEVGVPVPLKQGEHPAVGFLTFSNFTPQLETGSVWDQRKRSNHIGRRIDARRSAACVP